jgi:hypothetical protein
VISARFCSTISGPYNGISSTKKAAVVKH